MDIRRENGANLAKKRNLIVTFYDGNTFAKEGKDPFYYVQIELDHRDIKEGEVQKNLNLRRSYNKETGTTDNSIRLTKSQMDKVIAGADGNLYEGSTPNKGVKFTQYGIKADLMKPKDGKGLIPDTRTIEKSDFGIDEKTFENQLKYRQEQKAMREADDKAKVSKGVEATPEVEQEFDGPEL